MTLTTIILTAFFTLNAAGFTAFALTSLRERQARAARLSAVLTLAALVLLALALIVPNWFQNAAAVLLGLVTIIAMAWLFWPVGENHPPSPMPSDRVDERTIPFARARLQPGTYNYTNYYTDHPEHQASDDAFRQNPGLLEPGAAFYDPLLAASPKGGFFLTEALRRAVNGPVAFQKTSRKPETLSRYLKNLASYHGAYAAGICELQPHHLYSNIGRGTGEYGASVTLDHRYAIAITVEMDHAMINASPNMPAVMESARQYAESAKIAVILAAAIRSLGYPARAHIDGNYRVIAPLVAKDAGLGEIGRMGLLMTPRLGPRVRLAIVTTDLPLTTDQATWDPTVVDFCTVCNKCAAACPAQAIPFGKRKTHPDGTLRWKLNAERCYTYWTRIGTDCGRCMAVCPYSHPDNLMHNLIRFGVNRSGFFRRAASALDDLFYGKKPTPLQRPDWIQDQ
jgi:reductive dehalogenase